MEPSPDNLAAVSLTRDTQARNARKVRINANVTFFIWILEWMANITTFIASFFALKFSIFPEYALIWYYVVLPNTYLMNTSHNKDRIVDDGLGAVLRNALRSPFDFNTTRTTFFIQIRLGLESLRGKTLVSKVVDSETSSKSIEKPDPTSPSGIYVISKRECSSFAMYNIPNVPSECASTSNGITYIEEGIKGNILARTSTSESIQGDENGLSPKESHISIGHTILSYMRENVSTEEAYLHYLVQIIDLEDKVKDKGALWLDFEISPYISDELPHTGKATMIKGRGKNKFFLTEYKSKEFKGSEFATTSIAMLKTKLRGSILQRTEMRKTMLEDFSDHCKNEESYEKYLCKLFDFEEDMIEN